MHIYTHIYICIYIHIHTHTYTYIYTYINIHAYIYIYIHTYTHTHTHIYIYIYIYILLDRQVWAWRSARSFASVASFATCGGGLTVGDGRQTKDLSGKNCRNSNKTSLECYIGASRSSRKRNALYSVRTVRLEEHKRRQQSGVSNWSASHQSISTTLMNNITVDFNVAISLC